MEWNGKSRKWWQHINFMTSYWIVQCFTSPPTQYRLYGSFYRSKDPTNSIKILKEATKENNTKNKENTKFTCIDTQKIDEYSIQV